MNTDYFPPYNVSVFDPSARLPSRGNPKRTCGLWRVHSRHDTFEEAFEEWKTLFQNGELFPKIFKTIICVFDGYTPGDRNTLVLDLVEAREIAVANEADAEKYLRRNQEKI